MIAGRDRRRPMPCSCNSGISMTAYSSAVRPSRSPPAIRRARLAVMDRRRRYWYCRHRSREACANPGKTLPRPRSARVRSSAFASRMQRAGFVDAFEHAADVSSVCNRARMRARRPPAPARRRGEAQSPARSNFIPFRAKARREARSASAAAGTGLTQRGQRCGRESVPRDGWRRLMPMPTASQQPAAAGARGSSRMPAICVRRRGHHWAI